MNGLQIIMLLFSLIAVGVDVYAIVAIVRSPALKYKPLWIIGSLFGFLGLGINWTNPNDIVFEFGIQIPVFQVMFFYADTRIGGQDDVSNHRARRIGPKLGGDRAAADRGVRTGRG